jgi:hypothetical protein
MSDLQVELSQIDRSDLSSIKNLINSGFGLLIDANSEFNGMALPEWYDSIVRDSPHSFAIRVLKNENGA